MTALEHEPGRSSAESLHAQLGRFASDVGELYRRQKERSEQLEAALESMRLAYRETVRSMAFVVEAKDAYTGQHLERCRVYGLALLNAIGVASEFPDAEFGFLLHDVGKVGVPERILNKPGPLTAAEWRVMRTHPTIGYQILSGIPGMENAGEIVRCHHEMWSGDGYPAGLAREEIPLPARVFQVVDAFDAMTTDRPYRAALSVDHAVGELGRVAGSQFDPDVVASFLEIADDLPTVRV
ncbi:MAG: HD domain-containing protein [Actinomycetota bacterium]|nr:HD domain-containing protein [Acidimicrobiia bacterium]MDQ3294934.1 HD domain-containing protein [Actinomycetota bacterium]